VFSGYLYYDSMHLDILEHKIHQILLEKGIFNFLAYANLAYGHPRLSLKEDHDVFAAYLTNEHKFARIHIPKEYFVHQFEGTNCGIFICLMIMEFAFVHS